MQDASAADLMGVLGWDLMHLNKNGFTFAPNAGGISGLVDETTFFHPIYSESVGVEKGLEKTLEGIVATQYIEIFATHSILPSISQASLLSTDLR